MTAAGGAAAAGPSPVCVTGGLGFVGRHLCRALAERGHEVVCVDRAFEGRQAEAATELAALPAVRIVAADLASDSLGPVVDGVGAVVHLAALPGARTARSPAELWRDNVLATSRVTRAAAEAGVRIVFASTSSVYGEAARRPTPEDSPLHPLNPYAASKVRAEQAVQGAVRSGADAVVCRLFTVFGPQQRPDMAFARWIDAIASGRTVPWCARPGASREFTYIDDAVSGLIAALRRGRVGETYNLAGSGPAPVRYALSQIEDLLGRRASLDARPARPEALTTAACGRKAREELGHVPLVGLHEGLERQVQTAVGTLAAAA